MTAVAAGGTVSPAGAAATTTLVAHLRRQVDERPDAVALYFMAGKRWAPITWSQVGVAARRVGAFLLEEGVAPGDHVAIWSANRPEWHIADAGVLGVRARPVPVYLTLSAEQAAHVLGHSEAVVALVETPDLLERLLSVRDRLPALRRVVVMSGMESARQDGFAIPWTQALEGGQRAAAARGAQLDRLAGEVAPEDVATLIYTSGTTGPPKAAMLTHANILAGIASLTSFIPASADDRILSYLPLAHIAERMNSEFRSYVFGNATWFAVSPDRLAEHLTDIRPTLFFGVPRVWEKMAARIREQVDAAPGPRGRLARWAVRQGMRAAAVRERGETPSALLRRRLAVADRLVLSRIRVAVGLDQARILASGAAPIAPDVLRLLAAVGLEVCEVYGQTEGTGTTSMNRPGRVRIGTVGPPLPGVEVRIAGDGEILVRSPMVFAGYHRDPEATAEAVRDGWLHTGDVGELDDGGRLRITDRKKDLIITSGGKNISPAAIETALARHPLVADAVAVGDRRPYVTALLTLDAAEAGRWRAERGTGADGDAALRAELQRHVDAVNATLSKVETVKRWHLLERGFEVGVELTPTLKVRRPVVMERYAPVIETMYAGAAPTRSAGAREQ